jgi:methylmalonyl-CoA mutase N-terminal domain/subunit
VNVVRVSLQALAAVLGGAQSLHTNSRDEALGLPTEAAATLALRTQQVIGYESGVTDIVDPLGGAYAIEALTDQLEAAASALIARIDQMGGMVAAIEEGFPQREIEETAYRAQRAIETKQALVVGVNAFEEHRTNAEEVLVVDPNVERAQVEALRAVRTRRNAETHARAVQAVEDTARSERNLLPPIREAVRAEATVGEISDALRRVFGEHRPR